MLVSSVIALLLMSPASWKKRLLDGLLYGLLVCAPDGDMAGIRVFPYSDAWGAQRASGQASFPSPSVSALRLRTYFGVGLNIAGPAGYETQKWWMSILLLVLATTAGWALWRSMRKPAVDILWLWSGFFALYALIYILVYFGAYASTFPTPDLVFRMFEPFLLATGLSLLGLFTLVFQSCRPSWISSVVVIGLVLLMVVPETPVVIQTCVAMHQYGNGYTGKAWMGIPCY